MIQLCKRIAAAPAFERAIIAIILLNAALVGVETVPAAMQAHGQWLHLGNKLVLAAFIVEALIKIVAHAPRYGGYFRSGWNVFDFSLIVLSLIPASGEFAMVARLIRLLRVLRLVTAVPKLRLLVATLLRSVPGIGYVVMLMGVLFYVYGVTGYFLFHPHDPQHWGSLGAALLTLFQIATLEGWADIMRTAMEHVPYAWIYFLSFVLVGTFVLINLFVAVVINSLEESHKEIAQIPAAAHDLSDELKSARAMIAHLDEQLERVEAKLPGPQRDLGR
jgi:voltage-gated sodium channel